MMPVHELLQKLAQSNVKLWVEDDRLRLSAPSGVLTKDLQEELRLQKSEILRLLMPHPGNGHKQTIQPTERTQRIPLSFAQQRLWFLAQLEGPSATYNLPSAFSLQGKLEPDALQRALDSVVARHEILRTTFTVDNTTPIQVVSPAQSLAIAISDLSAVPAPKQSAAVQQQIDQDAQTHFDLAQGPLLLVRLLKLNDAEHVLSLNMHHIISDGWSAGIFMQELCTRYIDELQGRTRQSPPELQPLALQYADYAIWQQQQTYSRQLDFWYNHLVGAPPLLNLPTDHPRPPQQHFVGDQFTMALNLQVGQKLEQLAREQGATLHMTLLSAFALLLYRYSGSSDVVIGTPVANRSLPEIEPLIGFFVNTLALRLDLSGNPTFSELLHRLRQTTLDGYAHQDAPFEQVVERLQPQRQLNHTPLFQVVFNLMTLPPTHFSLPGLRVAPLESNNKIAKFDLALNVSQWESEVTASWEYNSELFDLTSVQQMARHWQTILAAVSDDPHQTIAQVPLFAEDEVQQMLEAGCGNLCQQTAPSTIHQQFEQQVAATPYAMALLFGDSSLTYRQLNERANQLAHFLNRNAIQPGSYVGISMGRSPEMLIAILGILKAGAAYVPLDPELPEERLRFMASDAGICYLLTSQVEADRLGTLQVPTLQLDAQWEQIASESTQNPPSLGEAASPIYLIYTSGSTGSPKGVIVPHSGVVNTITAIIAESKLRCGDRLLQFVPFSFDASALEFFATLCSGATLVLHPNPTRLSSLELLQVCQEKQISAVSLTVAPWHQWVDDLTQQELRFPASLRLLLTGGEKPSPQRLVRWAKLGDHPMQFVCSYGPTEASITSTIFVISNQQVLANPPVNIPLGQPLPNTSIYLLDANQQLVPPGVVGEIYLGGRGLAIGYLNQPVLTAERFRFVKLGQSPMHAAHRLYRTGDLARRTAQGALEFVGRIDSQIKIRGFRVELGEIEAMLKSHPQVTEAVVCAIDFSTNDKRLVAYLQANEISSTADIKLFLAALLPAHMIPAALVPVEKWPLTHNGKIDRNALPMPNFQEDMALYVAPESEIEAALAAIWESLLGQNKVSVESNFFDLGGHSLLATQVVSRIRQELQMEVPLRLLFEKPTVRLLAAELTKHTTVPIRPPLQASQRVADMPLSFTQQRLWLLQQLNPESSFFNMPMAFQLRGRLNETALRASFNEIVRRHEVLRTAFPIVNGQPVQQIAGSLRLEIPLMDLRWASRDEQPQLARMIAADEAAQPFDLTSAPLLRIKLLQMAEDHHFLLLTMHHIVGDDWSNGLLMGEFSALYLAFDQGKPSPLPELSVQYADFAHWQRTWLQDDTLQRQLDYWRNHLADAPPLLQLPLDRQRPAQQRFVGSTFDRLLPAELAEQVLDISRQQQITPHGTLFAAFAMLLSRYSGMDDLVIGIPVANRTHAQIEPLVGCFLNTLALRVKLTDRPTFLDLLRQVRSITSAGYEHQDVPFEQVSEALATTHQLSHTPIFQVMFNYLQEHGTELRLPGLEIEPFSVENHTAKFDLTLTIQKRTIQEEAGQKGTGQKSAHELALSWEYNSDIFDQATIERMAHHFEQLLNSALATPSVPVAKLSLLSQDERQLLLNDWNQTAMELPEGALMHQLFEEQAARTPDAIAASLSDELISYRRLNERANRWARRLRELGVQADTVVAVLAPRDLNFLTAVLAVHKAGGAYLPIDPKTPAARILAILQQSSAPILLASQALLPLVNAALDALPIEQRPKVVWIQTLQHLRTSAHNLVPCSTVQNLAYVIFTSGSTGVPKGAMVEQRGLVNHLFAMRRNLQLGTKDVIAQSATQSYVISVWQFMAALTIGCRVEIIPDEVVMQPERLLRTIAERKVTVLQIVPSLLQAMMPEIERSPHLLRSLRWLIPTGEVLSPALVRQWLALCPQIPLLNAYGASECSDDVAHDWISEPPAPNVINMPAGRPIGNVRMYVLDGEQQPVPIGVEGDLYVGGACVGRGYLHDDERTTAVFQRDPFCSDPPARLYKTGDRARWLANGKVEYRGRKDFQVKIRGFRIELGEIETILTRHPAVDQAVVVAHDNGQNKKQLVAYVVASLAEQPTSSELRAFVALHLPEYMVPTGVIFLECMPLNANGKLNRLALPPVSGFVHADSETIVAARNEVEARLVTILADILHLEPGRLSVQQSFFDLGGHSLLAVQLLTQLRQQFGVDLPLRTLFEHTTVEGLANLIIESQLTDEEDALLLQWLDKIEQESVKELHHEGGMG